MGISVIENQEQENWSARKQRRRHRQYRVRLFLLNIPACMPWIKEKEDSNFSQLTKLCIAHTDRPRQVKRRAGRQGMIARERTTARLKTSVYEPV